MFKEERQSYSEMIDLCCSEGMILNNIIYEELGRIGKEFEVYCGKFEKYYNEEGEEITEEEYYELEGSYSEPVEIYQYYIIDSRSAERLAEYTNEIVFYNEDTDLYLLGVTHYGTPWSSVPANWK